MSVVGIVYDVLFLLIGLEPDRYLDLREILRSGTKYNNIIVMVATDV